MTRFDDDGMGSTAATTSASATTASGRVGGGGVLVVAFIVNSWWNIMFAGMHYYSFQFDVDIFLGLEFSKKSSTDNNFDFGPGGGSSFYRDLTWE
jgi:hypothetical protein